MKKNGSIDAEFWKYKINAAQVARPATCWAPHDSDYDGKDSRHQLEHSSGSSTTEFKNQNFEFGFKKIANF